MAFLEGISMIVIPRLIALVVFALFVTVSGVIIAIRDKQFEWKKLGDFAGSIILPKVGGWLCLALPLQFISADLIPASVGWTYDALVGLEITVYGAVLASLIGHLLSNLHELNILPKYTQFKKPQE